jgi:hypothetical protein
MIFQFLSKETAAYDQDQHARMAALPGVAKPSGPVTAPALSGTRLTQSVA